MIAAHLPHIPRIPEWDVRRGLPIRGFFTMHGICSATIKNGAEKLCTALIGNDGVFPGSLFRSAVDGERRDDHHLLVHVVGV